MTRTGRATSIIWKTVVAAGAMIGCAGTATTSTTPAPEPAPVAEAPPPAPAPAPAPEPAPPPPPVVVEPPPPPAPPAMVTVSVTSKPAGADVYLDDKLVGKTPMMVQLPMGAAEVSLKVQKKGYADQMLAVKSEADQELKVTLKKAAKRPRGVGNIGTFGHGSGSGKGEGRGFILS